MWLWEWEAQVGAGEGPGKHSRLGPERLGYWEGQSCRHWSPRASDSTWDEEEDSPEGNTSQP